MRGRRRQEIKEPGRNGFKYLLYLSGGVLVILVITFITTFVSYNNKLKESTDGMASLNEIIGVVNEEVNNINSNATTSASSSIGQAIDNVINSMENEVETSKTNEEEKTPNEVKKEEKTNPVTNTKPEKPKDPKFSKPVAGETVKEFADDTLIFSETLQEWTRHLGIDIKADRATVVKSAEAGKITAIKNDPRYGLTVVIEHVNGFKTIYSNLLTTEFVSEGEEVKKGQSLGTVGNSAAFEIVDEPHLHFEIIKDEKNLDPSIYLK